MFLSLKTLYRKRTVIWPFYFYTIIRTLSPTLTEQEKAELQLDAINDIFVSSEMLPYLEVHRSKLRR